ncbi:CD226 antigen isoform X1 [Gadus morhua]|uniref:CD226 antigen isoform X1 n=1 Tax=Gadus morhua TaxID=8049 RepID=UPI0011B582D2|nr:CD226 antigen isoform X1 [Gadus morhua]
MASVPTHPRYLMVLSIFLSLLKVSAGQRGEPLLVGLQEGMVLDCRCPWNGSFSMVTWTKSPDRNNPIAIFHPVHGMTFSWRYSQRVEFPRAETMDGSIVLRNITHQDLGVYHCTITTFPLGSWSRDVTVEDQDEPPEEEERFADPPGPAFPPAAVQVTSRSGDGVSLPCSHGNGGHDNGTAAVLQVIVERYVDAGLDILWSSVASGGASGEEGEEGEGGEEEGEEGEGGARVRVNCTEDLSACSLRMEGVTPEDGGLYRCRFVTATGKTTANVTLTVTDAGEFRMSDYVKYLYIGGGAAGFLLLLSVFLVLLTIYWKKKRREESRLKGRSRKYDWQPANPVPSNTFLTLPLSNQQGGLLETNNYVSRQRKEEPVYGNVPSASRLALARSHKAAR